jgi:hypothetical protein
MYNKVQIEIIFATWRQKFGEPLCGFGLVWFGDTGVWTQGLLLASCSTWVMSLTPPCGFALLSFPLLQEWSVSDRDYCLYLYGGNPSLSASGSKTRMRGKPFVAIDHKDLGTVCYCSITFWDLISTMGIFCVQAGIKGKFLDSLWLSKLLIFLLTHVKLLCTPHTSTFPHLFSLPLFNWSVHKRCWFWVHFTKHEWISMQTHEYAKQFLKHSCLD